MSLPSLSVRRPLGTAMIFVAVCVLGIVGITRLPVDLMPAADVPRISVTTLYEGVAPEEIETLITRPVEQALSTIQGVTKLDSSSSEGLSRVQLEFAWGSNLDTAVNDVRAALDRVANRLPEDAEPPVTHKFDLSALPIVALGLSGTGDPGKLRYLAEETLARRLERVSGVAAVDVRGGRVREVHVLLDASRLAALGIAAQQVSSALAAANRNVSAGSMLDVGKEVIIRSVGEFPSLEAIESTVVTSKEGRSILVRELGRVVDTYHDRTNEVWIDGVPGIQMRVSKQDGTNTIEVVENVKRELETINRDYEGQAKLTMIWSGATFIENSVANVRNAALFGGALAIAVLLLFLRSTRGTFVIGLSIPVSILATFALMDLADLSLNVVSFGGLALGIGMLVDNAIVILENIYRKRESGSQGDAAASAGSEEVASAIVASTITTLVVFAPVVFIGGFAGIFFREMAVVVCFALICSLFVALTLVPSLSARMFRRGFSLESRGIAARAAKAFFEVIESAYERVIRWILRHPKAIAAGSLVPLAVTVALFQAVGTELMPETDEGSMDINVDLPLGTPVEVTMGIMQDLEARVLATLREGELDNLVTIAGPENWWRPAGGHQGELELLLVPASQRSRSTEEISAEISKVLSTVPGLRVQARRGNSNPLLRFASGGGDRLQVEIRGHDPATAARLTTEVERVMREVPGVTYARAEQEPGALERAIHGDRERLAQLGLSPADLASAVEHYVLGKVATRYRDRGDEIDVRVRLEEEDRVELSRLSSLPILTPTGHVVPLGSVARIEAREGPSSIGRIGQERVVRVNAGFAGRSLGDLAVDVREALRTVTVPDGFTLAVAGELSTQAATFDTLSIGILLAIFLVYAVMVVQFESLLHPLLVMTAVPFASIGVVLALLLTGTTFNMSSFLGSIVLVGIVVNNAIVLVDYVNLMRREQGLGLDEALAVSARRRLRPILMTTSTTVLGMLPLALGIGEGGELQTPLAVVVIGGLLTSTLVTLVLIPVGYLLLERLKLRWQARSGAAAAEPVLPR